MDAARARAAAADARERELRRKAAPPKRRKTAKKGAVSAMRAGWRMARRAARSSARAVADLERALNADLVDASGKEVARFHVDASSVGSARRRTRLIAAVRAMDAPLA